jgi:hypothetical protein
MKPAGAALQGSLLYVGDARNHRLMIFDVASITNGENAVYLAGRVDGSRAPV